MSTLAVRPALPQDEIFLYDLYSAVRGPEFELAPISAAQREELIRMQFRAQFRVLSGHHQQAATFQLGLDHAPFEIRLGQQQDRVRRQSLRQLPGRL